jgi:hypothetical protein
MGHPIFDALASCGKIARSMGFSRFDYDSASSFQSFDEYNNAEWPTSAKVLIGYSDGKKVETTARDWQIRERSETSN